MYTHHIKACRASLDEAREAVEERHNLPDVEIDDIGELEMREYFEYRKWNVWVKKRVRWIRKVKKFLKYRCRKAVVERRAK